MAHWGFLRLFLVGDAGFWSKNGGRYVKLHRLGKIGKGKTCEKVLKIAKNVHKVAKKGQKMSKILDNFLPICAFD
jgi:hypothetical protein